MFIALLLAAGSSVYAVKFDMVTAQGKVTIVYAKGQTRLDSIAAHLLAHDIERVTGYLPKVLTNLKQASGKVIVIGSLQSGLIKGININTSAIRQKWESYTLQVISRPAKNISQALVIAGSDARGTAYGVFDVSERIGVSPWYWWADVEPVKQKTLSLDISAFNSGPPSVKYRGIFINDEDWGLQPWAAKTFEPETGDIGPKTYAKVFELLLRLKANLIWPAMHPSTRAFYAYPGNIKVAADYQIVIGSSHAEPMLRNNVGEWDEKSMGHFNYVTNKQQVYNYWESRVKQSSTNNAIYTVGMRGVHDSGMEGVKGPKEAVPLLEQIIADQRDLLKKYINPNPAQVPQAFTAYKEVLDVYDSGLKLPDDITLVWPDDNYGYIQRLSNPQEQARKGGSGIYYHASYWGRPHDYLWLSTTSPALMREEMMKAYTLNSRDIWVLNVGDIKPCEYNMQLFMDMAYRADLFTNSAYLQKHLQQWCAAKWGAAQAAVIADMLNRYYQLAWERRPEFMGWSQTEPTTPTHYTAYNHFAYGDEAQRRIERYQELDSQARQQYQRAGLINKDAYYELVYYPIVGASLMNQKFLYRDKAYLYGLQNRLAATDYAEMSRQAYQAIVTETAYYNQKLAGGKWNNILSMQPRGLPVYQEPRLRVTDVKNPAGAWGIAPEGCYPDTMNTVQTQFKLPVFRPWGAASYFVDVFLKKDTAINWTATASQPWIRVEKAGRLTGQSGKRQTRTRIQINWSMLAAKPGIQTGFIEFTAAGKTYSVAVTADNSQLPELQNYKGALEDNGLVSIFAAGFQQRQNRGLIGWQTDTSLGYARQALVALPLSNTVLPDTVLASAPYAAYDFFTFNQWAKPGVTVYTLPTHPLNKKYSLRYALSVDGGTPQVVDFKTTGRSEEWKQNVLSNNAQRTLSLPPLKPGRHQLKIYMIDPGVIIDRILINLVADYKPAYSLLPEARVLKPRNGQ